MNKGAVAADGSAEMLKSGGRTEQLIEILISGPSEGKLKEHFNKINGLEILAIKETDDGFQINLGCESDMRAEIYTLIKKTDWIILEMKQQKQTLENIFREITQEAAK